jgi:transcriptional regulator with XRE-family HTH domain
MELNYGEALKYQREINGYSQNEVAKKTKINQQAISLWESNKRTPSIDNCVKLANFYEITIDELIGRDNIPQTKSTVIYNHSTHNGNNNF